MSRLFLTILTTFFVAACGGGSGSSVAAPDVPGIQAPAAVTAVSAN